MSRFTLVARLTLSLFTIFALVSVSLAETKPPVNVTVTPRLSLELIPGNSVIRVRDTNVPVTVKARLLDINNDYRPFLVGRLLKLQWFKNGVKVGDTLAVPLDSSLLATFSTRIPKANQNDELRLSVLFEGSFFEFKSEPVRRVTVARKEENRVWKVQRN